jgi:hypothetical protein
MELGAVFAWDTEFRLTICTDKQINEKGGDFCRLAS